MGSKAIRERNRGLRKALSADHGGEPLDRCSKN